MSRIHVRMCVGGETYALPVDNVTEVGELGQVRPVPGSGPAVLGIVSLRGRVLPVFDLARVFGLPIEAAPSRLVVAELDGRIAGLAVDEVSDVAPLAGADEATEVEFLECAVLQDGVLIGVIDAGRVFAALERGATG